MAKRARARSGAGGRALRPSLLGLEGRTLLAASAGFNFASAFGIGSVEARSSLNSDAVATDAAGDVYLTGSFRGTVGFDPSRPTSTLATVNTQDTFVAKYGPTGSLIWARTFAGKTTATGPGGATINAAGQGSAIAVDALGDVFVAGSFDGTVDFGSGSSLVELATPAYTTEVYAAKLDASGNLAWARAATGTAGDTDSADGLALDGAGGVVVAGSFADSATFGATTLVAGGSSEGFATRLDGSGNFLWAAATLGSNGSNAQFGGVAVDPAGNVGLAGFVSGSVGFAGSTSNPLVANGSDDAGIWKLDPTGHLIWARSFGSADYDAADALAFDASGNLYATGLFSDTVNFATGPTPDALTAGPVFDQFVLKLDRSGNEAWARGFVGPGWSKGQGVAVDPEGNVHVAGTFSGSVDFDPGPGVNTLTSVGSTDVSLDGLDANGNALYALQAGQTNANAALGLAIGPTGLVAITGSYSGSIRFGSTTLASTGVRQVFEATAPIPTPPTLAAPLVEAGSLTGSNNTTSITSPIFDVNGADPLDTVELLRNGVVVATRTGPGAIGDPGPVPQGTFAYTAIQVNAFGVAGPSSPVAPLTILTTPPATPPAPTLLAADVTGPVGSSLTNRRQFRLAGIAAANDLVQLIDPSGQVLGTATAGADGSYTIAPGSPLADGAYALRVRSVDAANNVGAASPPLTVVVLATPPASPSAPTINPLDITGAAGSGVTSIKTPRIVGTAPVGTTVRIVSASGAVLGSAAVGSDGTYSVPIASPLVDGVYSVTAVAVDAAANVSPPSPALGFTILATPPAAPASLALLGLDDSGTLGDRLTDVRQPRLTGKATPGATVQILDARSNVLASVVAGSDGTFVAKLPAPLADGTYAFSARTVDAANNPSTGNPTLTLAILATPPSPPSVPSVLAADASGGPNLTNVRQPRLTGKAAAGVTVQIVGPTGTVVGSAVAGSDGTYSVPIASPLADGSYSFRAVAIDAAANTSAASPSLALTILATPPGQPDAPTILAADDTGVLGDGMTADRRPRITGRTIPGGRVSWIGADGSVIATATASTSTGSYTLQDPAAFPNGTVPVRIRVTDAAGNVSPIGLPLPLTIRATVADFYGDSRTGVGVFRPGNDTFYVQVPITLALAIKQLGKPGDLPISGDFYGDGRSDVAVYTASTSTFSAYDPATGASNTAQWGVAGDVPVPGDYDGVGAADVAIYRPSTSTFAIRTAGTYALRSIQLGQVGDIPVPADYFGNGRADVAVFHPATATFTILDPGTGATKTTQFGAPGDVPVPADYEGIGRADAAVFRPATQTFYVQLSNGTVLAKQFGRAGDVAVYGDFFGLGHASLAVFDPATATTSAFDPVTGAVRVQQWGVPTGDLPITPALTSSSVGTGSGGGADRGISPPGSGSGSGSGGVRAAIATVGTFEVVGDPGTAAPTVTLTSAATTPRARKLAIAAGSAANQGL